MHAEATQEEAPLKSGLSLKQILEVKGVSKDAITASFGQFLNTCVSVLMS